MSVSLTVTQKLLNRFNWNFAQKQLIYLGVTYACFRLYIFLFSRWQPFQWCQYMWVGIFYSRNNNSLVNLLIPGTTGPSLRSLVQWCHRTSRSIAALCSLRCHVVRLKQEAITYTWDSVYNMLDVILRAYRMYGQFTSSVNYDLAPGGTFFQYTYIAYIYSQKFEYVEMRVRIGRSAIGC